MRLWASIKPHLRRPRSSQSGRKKTRDESFQAWAEEPLGTDSHWTISKWSSECWFLIGRKKCFVLLCPIGEQFLLSSFREFVNDGYYLATVARFVHQAFLTRNEGSTDESKNVSDAISRSNSICTEKILFLTDHNVSWIIGSLRCSGNSLTRQNNNFASSITLFCTFLCHHYTTTT